MVCDLDGRTYLNPAHVTNWPNLCQDEFEVVVLSRCIESTGT
jgi:hypothetical protein